MTEAVTVRRDGDTFQARMFWLRAARLLFPDSPIARVAFETGPKSFDDIWVDYAAGQGQLDQYGRPLGREHIQCKWHVTPGSYGYAALVDPEFINANARSLLQRAFDAHRAARDAGVRFKLLTNWLVDRDDPLRAMIGTRSGALRHSRLFDDTTDRSRAGRVRKLWRDHLDIDDDALRAFAGALAFGHARDSLEELRDMLDAVLLGAGLRRIPLTESVFPYDDLVFQWMSQGRLEFDRASLLDACRRENLLAGSAPTMVCFGIKSFEHPIDPLQMRCAEVLDLTSEFDERFIRDEGDWSGKLYPKLSSFLRGAAQRHERLRLALDAHASLAFAAGSVLDLKSGRVVELEQRSPGRQIWTPNDQELDPAWPLVEIERIELDKDGPEFALAVGFTHDIGQDVVNYARAHLPNVSTVLACSLAGGARADAVKCGRHAFDIAQRVASESRAAAGAPIHLFVAAPNALTFFLGQRRALLGRVTLYEFDFEGTRGRSYQPSLTLPLAS
jgi:hypothetical protein